MMAVLNLKMSQDQYPPPTGNSQTLTQRWEILS